MKRTVSHYSAVSGFCVLTFLALLLFGLGLRETLGHHPAACFLMVAAVAGLIYEAVREWLSPAGPRFCTASYTRTEVYDFFSVFSGAIITFAISVELGLSSVIASSLAGLAGVAIARKFSVSFYCGSFVGMASPAVFTSYTGVMLAGLIASAVFVLAKDIFNGFGGKLGTIAFGGCLAASLLIGTPLEGLFIPDWDIGWLILLYSTAGAVLTFIINVRFKQGPVSASAMVGLTAGILLPLLHGSDAGTTLAVMTFCASFIGMSGQTRFRNEASIALAGAFCGIAFIYTLPYMGGAGGKLGTLAFGSAIAAAGLAGAVPRLTRQVTTTVFRQVGRKQQGD